jgi:hypothetical protein
MKNFINKSKVYQAFVTKPCLAEDNSYGISHDWKLTLIVGFQSDGFPNLIYVDYKSEEEVLEAIKKLDLIEL